MSRPLTVAALGLLAFVAVFLWSTGRSTPTGQPVVHKGTPSLLPSPSSDDFANGTKFSGTVTSDPCANSQTNDTPCTIEVEGKKVIVTHGNVQLQHPWGSLSIHNDGASALGKRVDVHAHQTAATQFTLEGSSSYYVKFSQ
jgi:hypothetical protein